MDIFVLQNKVQCLTMSCETYQDLKQVALILIKAMWFIYHVGNNYN